jgi:hypothetical protein
MTATPNETEARIAVVRAADGVRFTASASDDDALDALLIDYIAARCDDVLWPAAAREVRRLIADCRRKEAIGAYFSNVGQRWDDEWLETTSRGPGIGQLPAMRVVARSSLAI